MRYLLEHGVDSHDSEERRIESQNDLAQIITDNQEKKEHTEAVLCEYLIIVHILEFIRCHSHAEAN